MSTRRAAPGPTPVLRVVTDDGREFRFTEAFHVGRGRDCEIRLDDGEVSRDHLEVACENGQWSVRDLDSGNGVFVDGEPVDHIAVAGALTVSLGPGGPQLSLEVESAPRTDAQWVKDKYLGADERAAGPQTVFVRRVLKEHHQRQRRWFAGVVAALAVALAATGAYAFYKSRQLRQQRETAVELFYAMKALDVDIANVEKTVASSGSAAATMQVRAYRERRQEMERSYDRFLANLNLYDRPLTPQELLILRVTRLLGECDIAAPPEYINEVMGYINRWRSSGRFLKAVSLAQEKGYTRRIAREFVARGLPPQFFYLAMQESDFNPLATGPPTRFGYAKGMWQFIPETAKRYGLSVGPLVNEPRPDLDDERHRWDRATVAAAQYVKDIYATDAQASALLVMASYNWGERRVVDMVRTLPASARDRNFWKLLARYRIPQETYDYVFYIVAAAVIGENPRLFGFPIDSPLAFLEHSPSGF